MSDDHRLPVGDLVPTPGSAIAPAARQHVGQQVALRPIDVETDAQPLFEGSHGPHEWIWTYMPYGPFDDLSQMRSWLQEISTSTDPRFFTVCSVADSRPIGIVSYLSIATEHRSIEVGHIWYVPQVHRSVVNTESIFLLLQHAFEDLRFRRVEWKCDALNARSRAAAERLGFRPEGIFAQHRIVRGRNRDTAWFAMMDHQWPRIGAAMRQWLATQDRPGSLAQMTAAE